MIDWDEIYTLKPHFPIFTAKKQRKTSDYEQEKVITNRRIDSSRMLHNVIQFLEYHVNWGQKTTRHLLVDNFFQEFPVH